MEERKVSRDDSVRKSVGFLSSTTHHRRRRRRMRLSTFAIALLCIATSLNAQGPTGNNMQSELMAACAKGLLPQSLCQAQAGRSPSQSSSSYGNPSSPGLSSSYINNPKNGMSASGYTGSQSGGYGQPVSSNSMSPSASSGSMNIPNPSMGYGSPNSNNGASGYGSPGTSGGMMSVNGGISPYSQSMNTGWSGPTTPQTINNIRSGFGNALGNANWQSAYNSNSDFSGPSTGGYGMNVAASNNGQSSSGYSLGNLGNSLTGYVSGVRNGLASLTTITPPSNYFSGQNSYFRNGGSVISVPTSISLLVVATSILQLLLNL